MGGNGQSGPAGTALDAPLVVQVKDAGGRAVEGRAIAFTIDAGGGQVAPASAQTGADGQASANWTLGAPAGEQRVQAKVTGSDVPATLLVKFSATAVSGAGSVLGIASGDNQTAPVLSALGDSLVVEVADALGNPVAGVEVQWTAIGGGSDQPRHGRHRCQRPGGHRARPRRRVGHADSRSILRGPHDRHLHPDRHRRQSDRPQARVRRWPERARRCPADRLPRGAARGRQRQRGRRQGDHLGPRTGRGNAPSGEFHDQRQRLREDGVDSRCDHGHQAVERGVLGPALRCRSWRRRAPARRPSWCSRRCR